MHGRRPINNHVRTHTSLVRLRMSEVSNYMPADMSGHMSDFRAGQMSEHMAQSATKDIRTNSKTFPSNDTLGFHRSAFGHKGSLFARSDIAWNQVDKSMWFLDISCAWAYIWQRRVSPGHTVDSPFVVRSSSARSNWARASEFEPDRAKDGGGLRVPWANEETGKGRHRR